MSIWGRMSGGAAGVALGGPLGAMLGVIAGSAFDRRRKSSFNYSRITHDQKQQIFTLSIIALSAKLAKSVPIREAARPPIAEVNGSKSKRRIDQ